MSVVASYIYKDGKRVREAPLTDEGLRLKPGEYLWIGLYEPTSEEFEALLADGETPVFTILPKDDNGVVCGGLVSGAAPEFVFSYSGDVEDLRIFFEGSADASLVVVGEEIVLCSDDSEGGENGNPLIDIYNPSGLYGVWVGRFDPNEPVTGTLTIVETTDVAPTRIAPLQPSTDDAQAP